MAEHRLCKAGVRGSIPLVSTSNEGQSTKLVESVVARLNVAKQDEIVALRKRLEDLERRVDALDKGKEKAA